MKIQMVAVKTPTSCGVGVAWDDGPSLVVWSLQDGSTELMWENEPDDSESRIKALFRNPRHAETWLENWPSRCTENRIEADKLHELQPDIHVDFSLTYHVVTVPGSSHEWIHEEGSGIVARANDEVVMRA